MYAGPGWRWGRSAVLMGALVWAISATVVSTARASGPVLLGQEPPSGAMTSIEVETIAQHVGYLASPLLEGRDSPSVGQRLAARYICEAFAAAGLVPVPDSGEAWKRQAEAEVPPPWSQGPQGPQGPEGASYLRPYQVKSGSGRRGAAYTRPDETLCALELEEGDDAAVFELGTHFVPVQRCAGDCRGELVWAGFAIRESSENYDDLRGLNLKGKVALIVEGEPRHRRKFKGEDVTALASIWNKIALLEKEGAAGVLIMRRPRTKPAKSGKTEEVLPPLSYRYTFASFMPPDTDRWRNAPLPALEISPACAKALLGRDVMELAEKIDRTGKPVRVRTKGKLVSIRSATRESDLVLENVVAVLPGSDPKLAHEVVVVGAHYDHIGVGKRGRVGFGADDNASGTSALLEIAEAFVGLQPRRTVMFAAFSAEEDGLVGSKHLASDLPYPAENVVAMVNMDMLGRGERKEVACMGFGQNPGMKKIVTRANKLGRTGVRRITQVDEPGLFLRSDHHSFHAIGVPVVFFMEGYPPEKNKDYHTWRDTPETLDNDKITATARLAFLTTWLLANEDTRLPSPQE